MGLSNWQIFALGIVVGMYLLATIAGFFIALTSKTMKELEEVLGNDD